MKLYDQTTYSNAYMRTHGDCNRACICTLLQIEPTELPHPIGYEGDWNGAYHPALRRKGYVMRTMGITPDNAKMLTNEFLTDTGYQGCPVVPRLVMAVGKTNRGVLHSVVYDRVADRMIHDPHPSRSGLLEIERLDYLEKYPNAQ